MNKCQSATNNEQALDTFTSWTQPMALTAYQPLKLSDGTEVSETITDDTLQTSNIRPRLRPNSIFAARMLSTFAILSELGTFTLGMYTTVGGIGPRPGVVVLRLSSLFLQFYYFVLTVCSGPIFVYYIIKGQSGSTIVPCMNTTWYKWLNVTMILLAVLMFITSALETIILPNGKVTTYPLPPP